MMLGKSYDRFIWTEILIVFHRMQGLGMIMQCKVHPNLDDLPMFRENGLDCTGYKIDWKMTYSIAENLATRPRKDGLHCIGKSTKKWHRPILWKSGNLVWCIWFQGLHWWVTRKSCWLTSDTVDVFKWIATLPLTSKYPHCDGTRLSMTIHPSPAVNSASLV